MRFVLFFLFSLAGSDYLIADKRNSRVQQCPSASPESPCTTVAETGVNGNDAYQLGEPYSVMLHGSDSLVISDGTNHRVQVCSLASPGTACTTVGGVDGRGSDSGQLNNPRKTTVDSNGDFVIADGGNDRVQLCSSSGECSTVETDTSLDEPWHVAFEDSGDYVIADYGNNRVIRCPASGSSSACDVMVSGLNKPRHTVVLSSTKYVISDTYNHRVLSCAVSPGTTTTASSCDTVAGHGGQGWGDTQLQYPTETVINDDGDYVIADEQNHRIQLCSAESPGTPCVTVAGTTRESGSDACLLYNPHSVYILDTMTASTGTCTTTTSTTMTSSTSTSTTSTSNTSTTTTSTSSTSTSTSNTSSTTTSTTSTSNTSTTTPSTSSTSTSTTSTSSTSTSTSNTSSTSTSTTSTSNTSTTTPTTSSTSTITTGTSSTFTRTSSTSSTSTSTTSTRIKSTTTTTSLTATSNSSSTPITTTSTNSTLTRTSFTLTNTTYTSTSTTRTRSTANETSFTLYTRGATIISGNSTQHVDANSAITDTATDITTSALERTATEGVSNATVAADSPCDQGEFLCDVGLLSVMAGVVVAFLCACACFCLLCGRLWHWRPPRRGQFHIESIGRTCIYHVEDKAETQKTHVVWEIDPEVLAGFQSVTDSGITALQSESGDVRGDCAATGTSGTLCREDASSPSESCSIAYESSSSSADPKGHQLVLRSHRHLSSDGAAVNVHPAYVHGAEVEYYSCTHRCWVRGLVTLDFLDRHVDGCWNTDAVVYGVRLFRSHQYRIHVALHHLRRPMETGQVIEACLHPRSPWKVATVKSMRFSITGHLYVLDLNGNEVTVLPSSSRPCFPENTQVFVYRGPTLGWETGVVHGVVPGASWTWSGSGKEPAHIVTRALKPIDDGPNTDFGVVPDPRIFRVEVAGKVESVPVHLLFRRVADESGCFP